MVMHQSHSWRVVLLLAATLTLALPLGVIAQEGALTDAAATPGASRTRVDVGGRAFFISCTGTGSPTVVLEAGSGNTADSWGSVQPEVDRFSRVCCYDRGGVGQSDHAPTGVRAVVELFDALY